MPGYLLESNLLIICWRLVFSKRPQAVAVHLMKPGILGKPAVEGYVGWTGMASASSLAQLQSQTSSRNRDNSSSLETVEIDPQFASALGFAQGDVVEIGLLHDLPVATSIATEPLSADDWEILVCFVLPRNSMFALTVSVCRNCTLGMLRITC